MRTSTFLKILAAAGIAAAAPLAAQIQTIDPNQASTPAAQGSDVKTAQQEAPAQEPVTEIAPEKQSPAETTPLQDPAPGSAASRASAAAGEGVVAKKDVFKAAEGVFGRGAEGLAQIVEDVLKKQGEPSGYITGSEAGGAFAVGVRYGKGTLHHAVEGDRPVFWTGPSVGFDVGADATKVFVLVYNLHDSQDLFKRYPGAEGNAYMVGGFTARYMRRGDVVLIPIRMGVGVRLGVNAGYMKFTEKGRWFPL